MKQNKINLDRKRLSKEQIESKQNFDSILKQVKLTKAPFWKSAWFLGSISLSGVAAVIGYTAVQSKQNLNETITTQNTALSNNFQRNQTEFVAQATIPSNKLEQQVVSNKPKQNLEESSQNMVPKVAHQVEEPNIESESKTTEIVPVEKPVVANTTINSMPSIDGVSIGDISFDRFKDGEILVGKDLSVTEYNIQYTSRVGDKAVSVVGSYLPADVIEEIKSIGLNQTVFITNVIAVNENGTLFRCYSMDLNVKFQ